MIQKILNSQSKSISSASLILAFFYLISALLGLFRDRLLAGTFGAKNELDVYYAAFTFPDFIALILIFGATSAAVIPIFSSYLVRSKEEAFEYLSVFLNIFLGFLILVCILMMFFTPLLVSLVAPGFQGEKKEVAASLMRIMFLSPIIFGLSNTLSGILQVFHRFLATALAPVFYNIGIIFGILVFYPLFGLKGLAWGVVLGATLHLIIQLPPLFLSGFRFKPCFNLKHPGILKTVKLMAPRSLGLGAGQLNTIAITAIGSTLTAGSIAVFNLANNLSSILINAISVSLSTAAFPFLSLAFLEEKKDNFLDKFSVVFRQAIFLAVPISVLILILRAQIVRVILGAGRFGWADTKLTSACLGIFAFSLCAQGLILILAKSFYASHNTKIPAIASIVTVILNVLLSLALVFSIKNFYQFDFFLRNLLRLENVKDIRVVGLAISFSLTLIIESIILFYFFWRKFTSLKLDIILRASYKILSASVLMGVVVFIVRHLLGTILVLETFWAVFVQLLISLATGILVYPLFCYFLKSDDLKIFLESFFKKFLY